jgi:hypothetical protein
MVQSILRLARRVSALGGYRHPAPTCDAFLEATPVVQRRRRDVVGRATDASGDATALLSSIDVEGYRWMT